jgi:uncharacterized protein (TIGR04255 family)
VKLYFSDQEPLPDSLPEYDAPPVVETSVGIQFDGLVNYTSLAAADFRRMVLEQYPGLEEQPPLDPAFETFGPGDSTIAAKRIQLVEAPISPRFFFISADATELLQLQRDRFFFNWRQSEGGEIYPRYSHVRERLGSHLRQLQQWAKDNALGEVQPTQCEAAYVNHIPLRDAEGGACGLSHIFPWLTGLLGTTESGQFAFRRRLYDESEGPVGRLLVNLRYGTDEEGAREAQLTLVVRGKPQEPTIDDSIAFISAAREVIVHFFTQITSDAAHKIWARKQ